MSGDPRNIYALALGSNQRHGRHGPPERVIAKALQKIGRKHVRLLKSSATIRSRPIGPSLRTFANAVAIVETRLDPGELLARLKRIEHKLGRRERGQRWQARVIDLDIILWSGGIWAMPDLTVPHIEFRKRAFVLGPLADIAGGWRDPISGLSVRQLKARLDRKRPAA
jgi:2-amino-4-hydroxy-6-hydroxymethyldihydropteridine diphosphokinase